jgi:hypothetical protein
MARFLVVLRPRDDVPPRSLIDAVEPLITELEGEIDHRTPAHLSAMLRGGGESLGLQLFADVQTSQRGPLLELVLISGESMGKGAPHTRECFENLLHHAAVTMPGLEPVFRSDRDGPVPRRH